MAAKEVTAGKLLYTVTGMLRAWETGEESWKENSPLVRVPVTSWEVPAISIVVASAPRETPIAPAPETRLRPVASTPSVMGVESAG